MLMDSLPLELLAIIVSLLDPSERARYATISRQWQAAVERLTFRSVRLKSIDLKRFSDVFVGHRRAALTELDYHVILPSYSENSCAKFENEKDKSLNNEAFTKAIHSLFGILHCWDEVKTNNGAAKEEYKKSEARARPISLTLTAYSPLDPPYRENIERHRYQVTVSLERNDLFERRYEHSFLRLLKPDRLPLVLCISRLKTPVKVEIPRRLDGASVAAIAAKLPNLGVIDWSLSDDEKKFPSLRQQHRYDFAQAISTLTLSSLKTFSLDFPFTEPYNHSFRLPSALHPCSPSTDQLSLALHELSKSSNLTHFTLTGPIVISPSLFWPWDDASPSNTSFWPQLQYFHVTINIATPDGEWYYVRDPDDGHLEEPIADEDEDEDDRSDDDDDSIHSSDSDNSEIPDTYRHKREARAAGLTPFRSFRTQLSSSTFNPVLFAMARAAIRMPRSQRLSLEINVQSLSASAFEATYLGPGTVSRDDREETDKARRRWYIFVGKQAGWVAPEELRRLWEESVGTGGFVRVVQVEEF